MKKSQTEDSIAYSFKSSEEYDEFCEKEGLRFGPFYEAKLKSNVFGRAGIDVAPDALWRNNLYQVSVFNENQVPEGWPPLVHLSIKRLDREPIHDWRDLQLIKNLIVGPEHEAVELFPAESRLVDSANQYHLYVIADPEIGFPFGFAERFVDDGEACGTKQKPWTTNERPDDCTHMTDEELIEEAVKQDKDRKSNQKARLK